MAPASAIVAVGDTVRLRGAERVVAEVRTTRMADVVLAFVGGGTAPAGQCELVARAVPARRSTTATTVHTARGASYPTLRATGRE